MIIATSRRILGAASLLLILGSCKGAEEPGFSLLEAAADETLFLSLAHPFDKANNDYELLISVPMAAESVGICPGSATAEECVPGSKSWYATKAIYATETRKFFKSESSALLEDELVLRFKALDAAGGLVRERAVMFSYTGAEDPGDAAETDATAGAGAGAGADADAGAGGGVTYGGQVKAILDAKCTSCHSPGGSRSNSPMDSYATAKASGAGIVSRAVGGTMPPGGALSAAEKKALTDWQTAGFPN